MAVVRVLAAAPAVVVEMNTPMITFGWRDLLDPFHLRQRIK